MQNTSKSRQTLGIIETVSLPELGVEAEYAKIDTGAYSGAIHCESVEVIRTEEGKRALRIVPIDSSHEAVIVRGFKATYATSSTGHRVHRYIIKTPIYINGKEYSINIGLATRDSMKTKVLIGRRFLRKYELLVDVTINQELDDDGGRKL